MHRWIFLGLIMIQIGNVMADSGAPPLKQVISKLNAHFQATKDFKANFIQIETNALVKKIKKSEGVIYARQDGKIFWFTQKPEPYKVLSDGKLIWLYYPKENEVYQRTWDSIDFQTRMALLFLTRRSQLEASFDYEWENQKHHQIRLIPKKKWAVEKVVMTLRASLSEIEKIKFYYPLERETELQLRDLQTNQDWLAKHSKHALDPNIDAAFQFCCASKVQEK
ncbi:MAG: outer membrane lipoprotein carrier protein LolA [Deltaproteobacteria bacterium]|nr:outer membrane lipoprotein carrier protein LolA [Deltaproteobacteria bacterium]